MNFEQKQNIGFIFVLDKLCPQSGFGKKAVKKILPFACQQDLEEEFDNMQTLIKLLQLDPRVFDALNGTLSHVKDIYSSLSRIGEDLHETELFELKNYCFCCDTIANYLQKLSLHLKNLSLKPLTEAYRLLNKSESTGFYISDDYSEQLALVRKKKREVTQKMISATGEQKEIFQREHLFLATEEENIEFDLRKQLSQRLLPFKQDALDNAKVLTRLDLLLQKAILAHKENCPRPVFSQDKFEITQATNPLISNLLNQQGKQFTPLSLNLQGCTVITGANMGGKTIALKTVALNVYAVTCGFFPFAQNLTMPFLSFVEILSEDLQSSQRGLSSFGGEIVKINQLFLQVKNSRGLLLVDEFAGGTNAEEGAKIFSALILALKDTPSFALLTTHFDGVSFLADERYQIIGLSEESKQKLRNRARLSSTEVTQEEVSQYMDYGLVKTDKSQQIPKDAIDICMILGLSEDILKHL